MELVLARWMHVAIVALTAVMLIGLVSAISGCGREEKRKTAWSGTLTDYESTSSWTEDPERTKWKKK